MYILHVVCVPGTEGSGAFRECLEYFLSCLHYETSSILEGVQFSVLSPAVHLITTIHSPGLSNFPSKIFALVLL